MMNDAVSKVDDFLTRAKAFTLSTVDGNRPRARPLGLHMVVDGSIVFGVGDFKDVYRQLIANPEVEITACIGHRMHRRGVAQTPRQGRAPPRPGRLGEGA